MTSGQVYGPVYFDIAYTFGNTESYELYGGVYASNSGNEVFELDGGIRATYLGNGSGTASGGDLLVADFYQLFSSSIQSGVFHEYLEGTFANGVPAGSYASAQATFDGQSLPLMGPFQSPLPYSAFIGNVPLSGLAGMAILYEVNLYFAPGTPVGSEILATSVASSPEPGTAVLLIGGLGLAGLAARRNRS